MSIAGASAGLGLGEGRLGAGDGYGVAGKSTCTGAERKAIETSGSHWR